MSAEMLQETPPEFRVRVMTTSQAADLYLGELARQGRTPRTIASYRRTLHKLADSYPHHDVEELTASMLRQFLDGYQRNRKTGRGENKPATIAQAVTIVRCFFKWLHDEDLIQRDPAERIRRPKLAPAYENDNVVTVSSEDVKLMLLAAEGWQEKIAVSLAVYSGARRHALATIRRSDYDPFDQTLRFLEKGGKTIVKPVAAPLASVLDAAIFAGVYATEDAYLIPGDAVQRRPGDRDDRVVWRIINRVAARAGVRTTVHALRAAFAVFYLETQGEDNLFSLQQLMGHSRVETTMVYLRRLDRRRSMETVRGLDWGIRTAGSDAGCGAPQAPDDRQRTTGTASPDSPSAECAEPPAGRERRSQRSPAGVTVSGKESTESLESQSLAEKEGFEPSFDAKSHGNRLGFPSEDPDHG